MEQDVLTMGNQFKESKINKLEVTTIPVFLRKSQYDGETDLFEIARTHPSEANWLFSPANQVWYNIGIPYYEGTRPMSMSGLPRNLSQYGKEFFVYHTHPKASELANIKNLRKDNPSITDLDKQIIAFGERFYGIAASIPSIDDLAAQISYQNIFHSLLLTCRIINDYGIISLSIAQEALANPNELLGRYNQLMPAIQDIDQVYAIKEIESDWQYGITHRESIKRATTNIINYLKNLTPNLNLHYKPAEQ